jgi:hypothetical protein
MTMLNIQNQDYQINLFVPLLKDGQLNDSYGLYHASLNGESYFILKENDVYQVENIKESSLLDTLREQTFSLRRKVERSFYNEANENLDKIQEMVGKWQEEIKNVVIEKIEFNQNGLEKKRIIQKSLYYDPLEKWLDSANCLKHFFYDISGVLDTMTYGLYQSKFDNELKFIATKSGSFITTKTLLSPEEFEANIQNFSSEDDKAILKDMLNLYKIKEEKNKLEQFKNIEVSSYEEEKSKVLDMLKNKTLHFENNEATSDIYHIKRYYLYFNPSTRTVDYEQATFIVQSEITKSYWIFEKRKNNIIEGNVESLLEVKENIVSNKKIIQNYDVILKELNSIEAHLIMPNIEQREELNILKSPSSAKAIVSEEGKELIKWLKQDSIRSLGFVNIKTNSFINLMKDQIHILKNQDTNEIKVIVSQKSNEKLTVQEIKQNAYDDLIKRIEKEPLVDFDKVNRVRSVLEKIRLTSNIQSVEEPKEKTKKRKI